MKHNKLFLLLLGFIISKNCFSQNSIAFTVSGNQGLQKIVEHYPVYTHVGFVNATDINTGYRFEGKLSLQFSVGNDSIADWSFKAGYCLRNGVFEKDYTLTNGTYSQSMNFLAIGRSWNHQMKKFIISAGIEFPFVAIGKFTEEFDEDFGNQGWHVNYESKGGWATGVNGCVSLKYNFSKRFFLLTALTAGYLYSKVGGESTQTVTEKFINGPGLNGPYDSKLTAEFTDSDFSNPEFYIGAGINF